jgi:hypothetical protein
MITRWCMDMLRGDEEREFTWRSAAKVGRARAAGALTIAVLGAGVGYAIGRASSLLWPARDPVPVASSQTHRETQKPGSQVTRPADPPAAPLPGKADEPAKKSAEPPAGNSAATGAAEGTSAPPLILLNPGTAEKGAAKHPEPGASGAEPKSARALEKEAKPEARDSGPRVTAPAAEARHAKKASPSPRPRPTERGEARDYSALRQYMLGR